MRKVSNEELESILKRHKLWLINDPSGERADLRGVDLREVDLQRAVLQEANLQGANLQGANLWGADLWGADLWGANLQGANLQGANLQGTNLLRADLWGADLQETDLRGANLQGANLQGANLWGTDLRWANLLGANLLEANSVNYPIGCPEKGSFTAFKKANSYIVELEIPEDAKRSSATSRKCRCSKAKVISITNLDGTPADVTKVPSWYDSSFWYTVGETVEVDDFDEDRWNECSTGIHFFITRQEAVDY